MLSYLKNSLNVQYVEYHNFNFNLPILSVKVTMSVRQLPFDAPATKRNKMKFSMEIVEVP